MKNITPLDSKLPITEIFSKKILKEIYTTYLSVGYDKFLENIKIWFSEVKIDATPPPIKLNSYLVLLIEILPEDFFIKKMQDFRNQHSQQELLSNQTTFDNVVYEVCLFYKIDRVFLFSKQHKEETRKKSFTIIIVLLLRLQKLTLTEIAELIGKSKSNILNNYIKFFNNLSPKIEIENQILKDYENLKSILLTKKTQSTCLTQ